MKQWQRASQAQLIIADCTLLAVSAQRGDTSRKAYAARVRCATKEQL